MTEPWPIKKLRDVATKVGSGSTPHGGESVYRTAGTPLIRSMNIHFDGFRSEGLARIGVEHTHALRSAEVRAGDVLMNITGASIGRVTTAPASMEGARVSQHVCIIRPKPELLGRFLAYYLSTPAEQARVMSVQAGATRQALTKAKLMDWDVPVPPLEEQWRIVGEIDQTLTRLAAGASALQRAEANVRRYRSALLKGACEGRLVPLEAHLARRETRGYESGHKLLKRILRGQQEKGSVRGRQPLLLERVQDAPIPSGWALATVAQLGEVRLGRQRSPDHVAKDFPTPYIRAANITERGLDLTDVLEMEFRPDERNRYSLALGDIVLSEASGTARQVGKPAIWRGELPLCCFQNTVIRLRPNVVNSGFLLTVFAHYYYSGKFASISGGVSINHLSATKFSRMPVPLPPLAEQARIVAEMERRLSVVQKLSALISLNMQRSRRLRESVLNRAFDHALAPQRIHERSMPIAEVLAMAGKPNKPQEKRAENERDFVENQQGLAPNLIQKLRAGTRTAIWLTKIHYEGDIRSLKNPALHLRGSSRMHEAFSPLCLVGLNGSGKSNLIELVGSLLCDVELALLDYPKTPPNIKQLNGDPFVLEYAIAAGNPAEPYVVTIRRDKHRRGVVFYVRDGDATYEIRNREQQLSLLPTRIVAYSSGLNETVSVPFFRNQAYYSNEVAERALDPARRNEPVEGIRSIFLDYECNSAVLVANFLFGEPDDLKLFEDTLRLTGVRSFNISYRRKRPTGPGDVKLTPELERILAKLTACASAVFERPKVRGALLSYHRDDGSHDQLKREFRSGSRFFDDLNKWSQLNSLALSKTERDFYKRPDAATTLLGRPPAVSRDDRIFVIDDIQVELSKPRMSIPYAGLSDGEHQFVQILGSLMLFSQPGTLFLLDEPETHFNPAWRRAFVQNMNQIRSIREGQQEIMISTHSPFLVSGCRGESVFQFVRQGAEVVLGPVDFETYGSSYELLLAKLFGLKAMISGQAAADLRAVLERGDRTEIESAIGRFGDSWEKQFLYSKLAELTKGESKQ